MINLGKGSVSAVKWSTVTTLARFSMQLIAQVVLARILGPDNYGIFGIGLVAYTFSTFLANFGFGWSLQQRETVREEDIRFAFTWQIIVGLIATTALYLLAPACADYFHEPRSLPVIQWLSIGCLISAAASPAGSLLQRDLNFRILGLIQVVSYASGYLLIGIPLALMDFGANALLAAWLTQMSMASLGNFLARRHSIKPLFWYPDAKSALGIGGTVFLTNITNWFLNNLDRILIGRLMNAQSVGLYTAGYNIATMPNALLLGALQPAFLSAGARLQSDHERLGQAYIQIIATILVLVLPFFVFLSSISAPLVQLLYGPKWVETGWILAILFLAMPAYVTWGLSTPILWNTGRKNYEFLLQLPILAVGVVAFNLYAAQGIHIAAAIAAGILLLRAAVIGFAATRALRISLAAFIPDLLRGVTLAAVCAVGAQLGQWLTSALAHPIASLLASGSIALMLSLALIFAYPKILGVSARAMILRFAPKISRFI